MVDVGTGRTGSRPRQGGVLSRTGWSAPMRYAAALAAIALSFGMAATPVLALADPPDVTGVSEADARAMLAAWDKSVVITVDPRPNVQVDESIVVVVSARWLNPSPTTVNAPPPRIQLTLGAAVPELTGLTAEQASAALVPRGFVAQVGPPEAEATWVVRAQRPGAGTLAPLGAGVVVILTPAPTVASTAPSTATPQPPVTEPPASEASTPDTGRRLASWALPVAAGVLVLVLVLLVVALLLRARRPRFTRGYQVRRSPPSSDGGPSGDPEPSESQPAPGLTVRLVPHSDSGTLIVKERRR